MRPRFTETFESYDRHCWENKRETFKRPREHQDASAPAASLVLSSARGFGTGGLLALPLKFKAEESEKIDARRREIVSVQGHEKHQDSTSVG